MWGSSPCRPSAVGTAKANPPSTECDLRMAIYRQASVSTSMVSHVAAYFRPAFVDVFMLLIAHELLLSSPQAQTGKQPRNVSNTAWICCFESCLEQRPREPSLHKAHWSSFQKHRRRQQAGEAGHIVQGEKYQATSCSSSRTFKSGLSHCSSR